jgi:hypothetical protein
MTKLRRVLQSIKKHQKATILTLLITLALFSYQEYTSDIRDKITNSHIDAAYRADYDNDHGGNAQPIVHSDGTYGVGFDRTPHLNITFTDCASWVVTRANGTIQTSGPSC